MLSDPLAVTYDSVPQSLPRTSGAKPGIRKIVSQSHYNTPDGQFHVYVEQSVTGDNSTRAEITLSRVVPGPADPFEGSGLRLANSVSLSFTANNLRHETDTDIPLIRAALNSLCDSTLQGRLITGEG